MITQKEIIETAHSSNVKTKTIDNDWVLGHFLNAMYSFEDISKNFIFKGGTCLKKCYFDDYRFSEDLDFTLLDKNFIVDAKLLNKIVKQAEIISGAKFYYERKKIQKSNDEEQGYEIRVKFWGADHKANRQPLPPKRWQTYIKLDISFSEKLLTKPVNKSIFHNYSDKELINRQIQVYSLLEIISEKLRSLIQRNRSRDIYDVWYISQKLSEPEYPFIKSLLKEKSAEKKIWSLNIEDFINEKKEGKNKRAWINSLAKHLPQDKLPEFDTAYSSVKQFVEKILDS